MNSSLQLLRAKRDSAMTDVQTIEAQLARLKEPEASRVKRNLCAVAQLFHEYIATLDESIHHVN
jgi:outer membrane murein-binding lipoprotein Lpp